MKALMILIAGLIWMNLPVAFSQKPQSENSIETVASGCGGLIGYVLGYDGSPVANAEVYVTIINDAPFVGTRPSATTNKDGKFFIRNASPGLNRVFAFKEEDGYPDQSFPLYQDTALPSPELSIQEGEIVRGVVIRLGRKWERLILTVADAETRSSIQNSTLTLYSLDNPKVKTSLTPDSKGRFQVLIPSVPASIGIRADRYKEIRDLNVQSLLKSLQSQAKLGKPREMTILLHRVE